MFSAIIMRFKVFIWQLHALFFILIKRVFAKKNKNIIFFPTNGVGLGHITRLISIATAMKKLDEEVNPIFFTTCPCLHLIKKAGFSVHHISPIADYNYKDYPSYWIRLLTRKLSELYIDFCPQAFVYDGPSPNWSLRFFFGLKRNMKTVWVRRKVRPEHLSKFSKREVWFDEIIEPGESGDEDEGAFPPVVAIDYDAAFSRDEGRRRLNIPLKKKAVYVQLGSDARPIVKNMLEKLKDYFSNLEDYFVVLGVSPLSTESPIPPAYGMILHDYPNAKYFRAFDLAISAAGYNTFHELLHFGVPTIFVPNEDTLADDQVERAMRAFNNGAALVVRETLNSDKFILRIEESMYYVLENSVEISSSAKSMFTSNGAECIAKRILKNLQ